MNDGTVIAIVAEHNVTMSSITVTNTVWKLVGGKDVKMRFSTKSHLDVLPVEDFRMVVITMNR